MAKHGYPKSKNNKAKGNKDKPDLGGIPSSIK